MCIYLNGRKNQRSMNNKKHTDNIADFIVGVMHGQENKNKEDFDNWVNENEYASEILKNLSDEKNLKANIEKFKLNDKTTSTAIFRQRVIKNRRRHLYIKISSIAASMIAISMMIYFMAHEEKSTITAQNEQIEKPIIITENGDIVNLSKLKNKNIAVSGNNIDIKNVENLISPESIQKISFNKFITPHKYTGKITLSDGTVVHLNSNSELKFPTKFIGNERQVELIGEGFFEVSKSDRRFIVLANGVEVKVYGTKFNVRACDKENVTTVLVDGSVSVNMGDTEIMLSPNEQCVANTHTGEILKTDVNITKYIAWTQNKFMCENDRFSTLIEELENWYGIKLNIKDEELKEMVITLIYSRDAPLTDIIEAIEMFNVKIKFTKTNKGYDISKN